MDKALSVEEALAVLKANRDVDLYMGADLRSWALTYGHGWVTAETVDTLLRTRQLARRWAEMPCYYRYGDKSIEKVVRAADEVLIPAVRDVTLALAMAEFREFQRRRLEEERQRRQAKREQAALRKREKLAREQGNG